MGDKLALLLRSDDDDGDDVAEVAMPACPASELRSRSKSSTRRPISSNFDRMDVRISEKRRSCKREH